MLYYDDLSCPVCKKPFEDGDDIVTCPKCGLPHHRACWLIEKHCYEENNHGTEQQWSRERASSAAAKGYTPPKGHPLNPQICPHCFTKNAEFAEFCTHCGKTIQHVEWSSTSTAPVYEYVPFTTTNHANTAGNTDEELSAVIGANSRYYLPRFHQIQQKQSGGWNWAALLLGPLWLIYRKQYALGILMFVFQCILDCATMWVMYPVNTANTEAEMLAAMTKITDNPMMFPLFVLSSLLILAHILLGCKGNQLYLHHCTKQIQKARKRTPDLSVAELGSVGGVSIGMAIFFYLISSLIANGFAALFLL